MAPPTNLQHYQILAREDGIPWELGRGTMGVTYKALDRNLGSTVALKMVNGVLLHDEMVRTRFLREARAAAGLRHRNVASVYHLGEEEGRYFYAMEFIDGETVEAWVRRASRLPVITALRIALQTTRALGAAHRRGLVHRDVKPANLMIVEEDDDEHFLVKLIDFGLVRAVRSGHSDHLSSLATVAGFVGTPAFASPEQLNEEELNARSDIYSLGLTLWFMLAGEPPFTGSLAVIYQQHLHQPLPWERLSETPETVRLLLGRMLEKNPDQRPQSATELRDQLAACLRTVLAATLGATAADMEEVDLPAAPLPITDPRASAPVPWEHAADGVPAAAQNRQLKPQHLKAGTPGWNLLRFWKQPGFAQVPGNGRIENSITTLKLREGAGLASGERLEQPWSVNLLASGWERIFTSTLARSHERNNRTAFFVAGGLVLVLGLLGWSKMFDQARELSPPSSPPLLSARTGLLETPLTPPQSTANSQISGLNTAAAITPRPLNAPAPLPPVPEEAPRGVSSTTAEDAAGHQLAEPNPREASHNTPGVMAANGLESAAAESDGDRPPLPPSPAEKNVVPVTAVTPAQENGKANPVVTRTQTHGRRITHARSHPHRHRTHHRQPSFLERLFGIHRR